MPQRGQDKLLSGADVSAFGMVTTLYLPKFRWWNALINTNKCQNIARKASQSHFWRSPFLSFFLCLFVLFVLATFTKMCSHISYASSWPGISVDEISREALTMAVTSDVAWDMALSIFSETLGDRGNDLFSFNVWWRWAGCLVWRFPKNLLNSRGGSLISRNSLRQIHLKKSWSLPRYLRKRTANS